MVFMSRLLSKLERAVTRGNDMRPYYLPRGVNRGIEIRRSVLFFGPNPSIRRYFCSNPDPHYVKSYCGIRLLQ